MKKQVIVVWVCLSLVTTILPATTGEEIYIKRMVEEKDNLTSFHDDVDVPIWKVNDSWTYDVEFNINFDESGLTLVLVGGSNDLRFCVVDNSSNLYDVGFEGDVMGKLDLSIEDSPIRISVELKRTTINGLICFWKSDLGLKKIFANVSGSIRASIEPIPIPFSGGIIMIFNPPCTLIDFPITVGKEWSTSPTTVYVNISSDFIELIEKILKLIGKIAPGDIGELLDELLEFIEELFPIETFFAGESVECKCKENITITAGMYETFKINFMRFIESYYALLTGSIVKISTSYEEYADFSMELKSTTYILPGTPNKPDKPSGPTSGKAGTEYTYTTSTVDPDGDKVKYGWDWNSDSIVDEWTDFYNSGEKGEISHKWNEKGNYVIRVKAKDENELESMWSDPLPVSMPKTFENPLKSLSEKMSICHIVSTGTGNFKILTGAIIHGLAGISAFSIDLENDGYTTISSLFNPDHRYTITGNQRMIISGYAGYFTWESKEDNAILSINGVALIATVTQTS